VYGNTSATLYFKPTQFSYSIPEGYQPSVIYDMDDDGLADTWEMTYFSNFFQSALDDFDNDGLSNEDEQFLNTDPTVFSLDHDSDGLPDIWEEQYFHGLDPNASGDFDNDGVSNLDEYNAGTNPAEGAFSNKFNPAQTAAEIVLTENDTHAFIAQSTWRSSVAIAPLASGKKYYWEAEASGPHAMIGIGSDVNINSYVGVTPNSYSWRKNYGYLYNYGGYTTSQTYANGDRIMVAFDPDAGKLWFGKNGVWIGDPDNGAGAQFSNITGTQYPAVGIYASWVKLYFKQTELTYTPPTGFDLSEIEQ